MPLCRRRAWLTIIWSVASASPRSSDEAGPEISPLVFVLRRFLLFASTGSQRNYWAYYLWRRNWPWVRRSHRYAVDLWDQISHVCRGALDCDHDSLLRVDISTSQPRLGCRRRALGAAILVSATLDLDRSKKRLGALKPRLTTKDTKEHEHKVDGNVIHREASYSSYL